ncbi:hypothetical protein RMSM_00914 [Rhodopirellula maiorica SM1]|uniref:Uncharacterized protein n=1 Tax=Rhodopirellula maiorica SM1 TaxID=1265738 RepID=M5RS37_9BACT|nr:hypothetical protein RMSM_00914 [Rhodopirellula maiorica SM1]
MVNAANVPVGGYHVERNCHRKRQHIVTAEPRGSLSSSACGITMFLDRGQSPEWGPVTGMGTAQFGTRWDGKTRTRRLTRNGRSCGSEFCSRMYRFDFGDRWR